MKELKKMPPLLVFHFVCGVAFAFFTAQKRWALPKEGIAFVSAKKSALHVSSVQQTRYIHVPGPAASDAFLKEGCFEVCRAHEARKANMAWLWETLCILVWL